MCHTGHVQTTNSLTTPLLFLTSVLTVGLLPIVPSPPKATRPRVDCDPVTKEYHEVPDQYDGVGPTSSGVWECPDGDREVQGTLFLSDLPGKY